MYIREGSERKSKERETGGRERMKKIAKNKRFAQIFTYLNKYLENN